MKNETPIECVGCNTFDVGSILDNSEVVAPFERVYETQAEAEEVLVKLTQKARDVESEPCQIQSEISPVESGFLLKTTFTFSCQAEVVIFQLGIRSI